VIGFGADGGKKARRITARSAHCDPFGGCLTKKTLCSRLRRFRARAFSL